MHVMLRAIPAIKLGTCRYSVCISFMFLLVRVLRGIRQGTLPRSQWWKWRP